MLLFGFGAPAAERAQRREERRAEEFLRAAIPSGVDRVKVSFSPNGPAGAWGDLESATIEASGFRLRELPLFVVPGTRGSGRMGTLKLRLNDFMLTALKVEELSADIPACRYDYGKARKYGDLVFSRCGVGNGKVVIRDDALETFILAKYKEIKRCSVKIDRGVIVVEGFGEFLVASTEFKVIARISCEDGSKLMLDSPRIYLGLEKADAFTSKALLKTLNPVVDLKRDLGLHDAVTVTNVKLESGKVVATGQARIPTKPGASSASTGAESKSLPPRPSSESSSRP